MSKLLKVFTIANVRSAKNIYDIIFIIAERQAQLPRARVVVRIGVAKDVKTVVKRDAWRLGVSCSALLACIFYQCMAAAREIMIIGVYKANPINSVNNREIRKIMVVAN